jgi:hypothetical protein
VGDAFMSIDAGFAFLLGLDVIFLGAGVLFFRLHASEIMANSTLPRA